MIFFLIASFPLLASADCQTVFTDIWRTNYWRGESRSGIGSGLIPTARIREAIPQLLQKYHCKTVVDAPCGDLFWMNAVDLPVDKYIGIDVVAQIIQLNQILFANSQRSFIHLDITKQIIPKADLVLCRDCLVHFSFDDVARTIKLLKQSGSTYLLTTNFAASHDYLNDPIQTGEWRPLDLRLAPYCFPEPIEILNEHYSVERWTDKSLFLWKIDDLPDL